MNPYLNFSLEGKVALVTGASYGIGFAIASAFAEQGAKICFNDINQELVDKGLAAYKEKGIEVHGYVCDVTDEPAVQAMVAQIEKEVGTIDILVNNAGIIRRIPMHEMAASEFRKVIDIDLNEMTMLLTETTQELPDVAEFGQVYLAGSAFTDKVAMEKVSDGVYTWSGVIEEADPRILSGSASLALYAHLIEETLTSHCQSLLCLL